MAYQRKKSEALGIKASFPASSPRPLRPRSRRSLRDNAGSTKLKFDGYRVQVHLANGSVRIFTRRGHDWTHRFKKVAHDAWHIKAASAVIDGEVVAPAVDGSGWPLGGADLSDPERS